MSDSEEHRTPSDEEMLHISPSEYINLDKNDDEVKGTVTLTCTSKFPITYKIKTTAPLKFRVRPSSGALHPGGSTTVSVVLQPGNKISSSSKDKFLVMCHPLPEDMEVGNTDMLAGFWKALPTSSPGIQLFRLQCVGPESVQGNSVFDGQAYADDIGDQKIVSGVNVVKLAEAIRRIDQRTKLSVNLHWLSLLVFVIAAIAFTYIIKLEIQGQGESCSKRY